MTRTRLASLLALLGLALAVAALQTDAPPAMFVAAGLIGAALALRYDPGLDHRHLPSLRDASLWLLASLAALGACSAVEVLTRPPEPAPLARIEWTLRLLGALLPVAPLLVRRAALPGAPAARPRLWPIAAGLAAWAIYSTAGWLAWGLVTTAVFDPNKVTPDLALWLAPPLALLIAIGAHYWWRALRRSPYHPFDDTGMFRAVVTVVMVVLAALLASAGAVLLLTTGRTLTHGDQSRLVAWLLGAGIATTWLVALRRIRAVPPVRARGAVAAVAILLVALPLSFALPIGFADAREWWQLVLLFLAPVAVAIGAIVLKGVPRLVLAALRF